MAEFSKLIITTKGQALMAKMIAGTGNIDFTKVCTSTTQYTLNQLESLTSLSNIKQTSLVSKVTRTNTVAIKIETAFSNSALSTGYYMRTLGLYAVDPDEGEILYAVAIETSGNCYMPPYNNVTVSAAYIQLYTTVGNSSNVSLNVDSGAFATIGDVQALEAEIADLKAYIGLNEDDVYGVEVDFTNKTFKRLAGAINRSAGSGFDNINAFGGRKRCNITDAGIVLAYQGDAAFTTTGALTQAVTIGEGESAVTYAVGTKVQTMVEQPSFYYKVVPLKLERAAKGFVMKKARYYVSDTQKAGFKLHPAFIVNDQYNDAIHLSAFEASLYDVSAAAYILDDAQVADFTATTGDQLASIANAKPISGLTQNLTRANTRKLAENRGTGWEQATIQTSSASQLLMLIEYASFNMQSAIGAGAVYKTDDGQTNMAENTGATVTLGNASGSVVNTNGIQIVSYRGEENPWGNIWGWLDGINSYYDLANGIDSIFIADHAFVDNTESGYVDAGITAAMTGGYISAFAYSEAFDWLFIPGECKGNSSLPVGDNFWQSGSTGWRVALLGAVWHCSLRAGAFSLYLYDVSSYRYRVIGGRLVFRKKVATA